MRNLAIAQQESQLQFLLIVDFIDYSISNLQITFLHIVKVMCDL